MTPLRRKMYIDLSLADYSEKTKDAYVRGVRGLAEHYNRSPEFISEDEVKSYLLHLKNERKLAASTLRQKYSGIRFLYLNTLRRPLSVFDFLKVRRKRPLPVVLSKDEVSRSFSRVKHPMYAMVLKVAYGGGLRISEALKLRASDVDRGCMFFSVKLAKGHKDRLVPLSGSLLEELENYWRNTRPKVDNNLLFPSKYRPERPPVAGTIRNAFHKALKSCGISKKAGLHTLRHSMATHLLEAKVTLKSVQYILGHKHLTTTLIYAHMTNVGLESLRLAMDEMVSDL
jgi:integrase/recombinase XerD